MDLRTENQYKENFLQDPRGFLHLFVDSFSGLYRYVARRVSDEVVREQITGLVYLDAIGQMSTCPRDVNFLTWLYGLARVRVKEYVKGGVVGPNTTLSSPIFDGAGVVDGVYDDEMKLKQQAETFFSILTLEEQEIIRLKFFEELTDGEVMYVLGMVEGTIGAKIYQVLKRGYEVLFGQVADGTGVYYGELHSFLSRLKNIEKIPVSETFKLKLRSEVEAKLERMYMDKFEKKQDTRQSQGAGRSHGARQSQGAAWTEAAAGVGSKDPAKAFVYAAKGMSKEEVDQITEEYVKDREVGEGDEKLAERGGGGTLTRLLVTPPVSTRDAWDADAAGAAGLEEREEREVSVEEIMMDQSSAGVEEEVPVNHVAASDLASGYENPIFGEKLLDIWERWKYVMTLVPTTLFVAAVVAVLSIVWLGRAENDGVTGLKFTVDYGNGFEETNLEDLNSDPDYAEKVLIEESLIAEIAEGRNVSHVGVDREDGVLGMYFKFVGGGAFDYVLEKKKGDGYVVREFRKL